MICFFLFVFGLPLFMSLCCLHLSNFDPLTQWIPLPTLLTKTFLNFFFFFLSLVRCLTPLVPIMPNYQSTKKKLYLQTLSLSYLCNAREKVTNTKWQSRKAKSQKKKKNTTGSINSIHNHQHQFSSSLISKNTNMKHHKSTRHKHSFCESQILRSQTFY